MISYESDERAVARAIAETTIIDDATARTIASWFNEPGHVHAFVSTGAMPVYKTSPSNALMSEIRKGVDALTLEKERDALDALQAYLEDREDSCLLDRVSGWSDMWVRKHVDYPHHDGALPECWCYDDEDESQECDPDCAALCCEGAHLTVDVGE